MSVKTSKTDVTTGPLPASRKLHIAGSYHSDIRVPMREISVHPTSGEPPLKVYDASGPYTDPDIVIDIERGLPRVRRNWIVARADTQRYAGRSIKPADNGFVESESHAVPPFPENHAPLRAIDGRATRAGRVGVVPAQNVMANHLVRLSPIM